MNITIQTVARNWPHPAYSHSYDVVTRVTRSPLPRREWTPPRKLAAQIAAQYNIGIRELFEYGHSWRVSHPRQHLMWLLRSEGRSFPAIARMFAGRSPGSTMDHTTVIYGVRAHAKRAGL